MKHKKEDNGRDKREKNSVERREREKGEWEEDGEREKGMQKKIEMDANKESE